VLEPQGQDLCAAKIMESHEYFSSQIPKFSHHLKHIPKIGVWFI